MAILAFLAAYWDSVLVVLLFLIGVVFLIKRGQTGILKMILFRLVTEAEKQLGSGTGSLKLSTVADWLYEQIPAILKLFFTAKDIQRMIEEVLEEAKKRWTTNGSVQKYIAEGPKE